MMAIFADDRYRFCVCHPGVTCMHDFLFGVVVPDALKHLQHFLPTICANSHYTSIYKLPTYFFTFRAYPVAKKAQAEKDLLQPGSTICLFPLFKYTLFFTEMQYF